jgi:hypothetical protein
MTKPSRDERRVASQLPLDGLPLDPEELAQAPQVGPVKGGVQLRLDLMAVESQHTVTPLADLDAEQARWEGLEGARHVPIEFWPEPTSRAMAVAFAVKAEATAERIREQMRRARCSCVLPAELADDGRCSRCWGWPRGSNR